MKIHARTLRKWPQLIVGAALLASPFPSAHAAPTVDGILDAEYGAPLSSTLKDDLAVDANVTPPIDDPALPAAKSQDVTNLYVTNSGNALYIYVQLPYYSFADSTGNWGIPMHLGGANDSLAMPALGKDPYGHNIYFNYTASGAPEPNVVLISNTKSTNANGWAYLMRQGSNASYNYDNVLGDIFGISGVTVTASDTSVHSLGASGAEIAYHAGDGTNGGIEIKIPFSMFAATGVLNVPGPGDTVKLQYWGDIPNRAAVDCVPFEAGARAYQDPGAPVPDYTTGFLSKWATYTIVQTGTPMDVMYAKLVDATHIGVKFSDNLSTGTTASGGANPANYSVVDLDNGDAVLPVTEAAIDSVDASQANLTFASLPYGHHVKVTVSNVQSASGVLVTATKNTATFQLPIQVTFELCDNSAAGLVQGKAVSVTGAFINWAQGSGKEIDLTLESGSTSCYQSAPQWITPGTYEYKYRLDYSDWDTLNRRNHKVTIPAAGPYAIHDVVGGPVAVTFNLTVYPDITIPSGSDVYVTGDWNGFSVDPGSSTPPTKLDPVTGKPGEYSGGTSMPQNVYEYKYVLIGGDSPDYDTLNRNNRTGLYIVGAGSPLAQVVNDTAGTPGPQLAARVLRIAGGLEASPSSSDAIWGVLNKTGSGTITVADAVQLLHP